MDLFGAHTSFSWRECLSTYFIGGSYSPMIAFGDHLYMALDFQLLRVSADLSSWKSLQVPSSDFALTTYHNQLVLLGGLVRHDSWKVYPRYNHTDKVWVSDDGEHWDDSSLPPLTSSRACAAAVNTGKPEFLVVIGGQDGGLKDTVEVLVDDKKYEPQWASLQSLPGTFAGMLRQPVLHNGNLLFRNFYCKLEELKAECTRTYQCRPRSGVRHLRRLTSSGKPIRRRFHPDLWKDLTAVPEHVLMISYKQQLLCITCTQDSLYDDKFEVILFNPLDDDDPWISIGTLTVPGRPLCACVHSTGEIVLLTGRRSRKQDAGLFAATLKGSVASLNKQCVYVIMSVLLEQGSLDPDQLPARLPGYVPPSVKHYLARTLRARTCMSPPPSSDLPPAGKRRKY